MPDGPSSPDIASHQFRPSESTKRRRGPVQLFHRLAEWNTERTNKKILETLAQRGITFGIYDHEDGRDTRRLEPYRHTIETSAYRALKQIAKELPISNVAIGVFDAPEKAIPEYGIGGYAHGDKPHSHVEIDLDPDSEHFKTAIGIDLKKTLRHELHHDSRIDKLGMDQTLLERMITEGLATHYEIQATKDQPSLYATAVKPEEIPALLEKARLDFTSTDYESWNNEWFFGPGERGIPLWTGYTLGHYLVGEYLKTHPGTTAASLYAAPAKVFVTDLEK